MMRTQELEERLAFYESRKDYMSQPRSYRDEVPMGLSMPSAWCDLGSPIPMFSSWY